MKSKTLYCVIDGIRVHRINYPCFVINSDNGELSNGDENRQILEAKSFLLWVDDATDSTLDYRTVHEAIKRMKSLGFEFKYLYFISCERYQGETGDAGQFNAKIRMAFY